MFNFASDSMITISPEIAAPRCGATRFRWSMHLALPYPFPTKDCPKTTFSMNGHEYQLGIHNHYDRLHRLPKDPKKLPLVYLAKKEPKGTPSVEKDEYVLHREPLQAVAIIEQLTDFDKPNDAYKGADARIKGCVVHLSQYLASVQRSLPYLVAWTVYPVTLFDVGIIYHSVSHFCPTTSAWAPLSCSFAVSAARQLSVPTYYASLDSQAESNVPEAETAYEMLAEAQMATFRSLFRMTFVNSCSAVELMANYTYRAARFGQLVKTGMPEADARSQAETERKRNRTDERFLLHRGLKDACGHSLEEEHKRLYDNLMRYEAVRHDVVHKGRKSTRDEATACHRTCCEIVNWLLLVCGLQTKPLEPTLCAPGFALSFGNVNIAQAAILHRMFNILLPPTSGDCVDTGGGAPES